jgi:ferritin-like metal-binding protein YciE
VAAKTLHDAFIEELRDIYDAEKQLIKALPKLARAARSAQLRTAFESHLNQTRGQVARLEKAFASINERPRGTHCDGMAGIIKEGNALVADNLDPDALDAALIAAGQRSEHYEMAVYGTLVSWARSMGHTEAARLLEMNLDEEGAADQKLSRLAENGINQQAAIHAHDGYAAKAPRARPRTKRSKKAGRTR